MDAISEARLGEVHPVLKARIEQLYQNVSARSVDFRITTALRTWAAQEALYGQGRTAPGEIVTNAPPGHSWHEFGLAVDFAPMNAGEPIWTLSDPLWTLIRDAGEAVGLVSGSRWHQPDFPHLQLTGSFPVSPTDAVRELYASGGISAVWKAANLEAMLA